MNFLAQVVVRNICDIFNDTGILSRSRSNDEEELQQNRISDSDYRKLVRSLNKNKDNFFYHVLHSIKTKHEPLKLFLSGGAGVGKRTVTNAFYTIAQVILAF